MASLALPILRRFVYSSPSGFARLFTSSAASLAFTISLLLSFSVDEAQAQVPPVPAAFPNNQTFTPGQLLWRRINLGRVTNIIYHNGNVYTNVVTGSDRRVFQWSNPNDITSFTQVLANATGDSIPLFNDHGNHAHTKVGDWIGGTFEMRIRRDSPGVNVFNQRHPDWIDSRNDHQLYWPWSLPFNWIQYSSENDGSTFVRRLDETIYEWNTLEEAGVTGNYILMGNILLVTSDESLLGILAYDISPIFNEDAQGNPDPQQPILLDKLSGPVGAYIAVLWQNYIVLSRRDTSQVDIVDWSDPTDLRFVTSISTEGTPALNAGTSVPYTQCQDEFIFTRRHKINMETFQPVLELDEVGNNRPAGSVSGQLGTSQYMLPVGQFLITGAYSSSGRDGIGIWAHQAGPDTRAPAVGYHIPKSGQTGYPTRAPISILIHETLESYTIISGETIILREAGTQNVVDCWTSFSHDDILTLTPKQPLRDDTDYEVIIPSNGIKDAVGNGIEAYEFAFSTGNAITSGNLSPVINSFTAASSPAAPGQAITFTANATDPENDPLEYKFSFADGTPSTGWISSNSITHTFSETGHYDVKVQVRDQKPSGATSLVTDILTVTIGTAPTGPFPTYSSPIILDENNRRVWVVNPDNDTVTAIDADTQAVIFERNLASQLGVDSADPRSLAISSSSGNIWVACHDADMIAVLNGTTGNVVQTVDTGYGSAPVGVVATPNGTQIFVTLEGRGATDPGHGQLLRFDAASRSETGRLELGPMPRAIAVTGNGQRILVTRFISPEHFGEIWDISNGGSLSLTRTITAQRDRGDRGNDGSSAGGGVPNYLAGISITPGNEWAWFPAKKDQTYGGALFASRNEGQLLEPDHTVRAMVGRIDLTRNREPNVEDDPQRSSRMDVDNSESPSAITFSPFGDYAFVALQGNNEVAVYDVLEIDKGNTRTTTWRVPAGAAPQGVLIDPATNKLWVKNFLGRSVTVHDLTNFFASGDRTLNPDTITTVNSEKLPANILNGKRIFYHASDQMSRETYISCASCHIDGSHDGRTFDFTQRGEGLRNTTDLRGRSGTLHGNVHWSANFDEVHDFIIDIMGPFGGTGFLPAGESPNPPLGAPNAGRSQDLDDLAAYVSSLGADSVPRSPFRQADGSLTADAVAGQTLFQEQSCVTCHVPPTYTDSFVTTGNPGLQNVGTLRTTSGSRLNAALTGIDTPTLIGLHNGAPFFHDGQAETIRDTLVVAGGTVYPAEAASLSGGASIPGFQSINWDGSAHGLLVNLQDDSNDIIRFNNVNGGSGGTGAVEVRYASGRNTNLRLRVNGTNYDVPVTDDRTRLEWKRLRVENINLNAGNSNTIEIRNTGAEFAVDEITVSTADDLALAEPHRRALNLTPQEQAQLTAYLLQLDGSSIASSQPVALFSVNPDSIPRNDANTTVVVLDGRGSIDPNGTIVSYAWTVEGATFVNGTAPSDAVVQVTFAGVQDEYSARLEVTDDDNNTASLTRTIPTDILPPPGGSNAFRESNGLVVMEAENGDFGSPTLWQTTSDASASGGEYIEVTPGNNSTATPPSGADAIVSYEINISSPGTYQLWARTISPNGSDNSFWVRLNDSTDWVRWNDIDGSGTSLWTWSELHDSDNSNLVSRFTLIAGLNRIDFAYREDGTRLDKIALTSDLNNFNPQSINNGFGPAESPRGGGSGPGIAYEYFEVNGLSVLPDFDSLTPVATGTATNFDLGVRQRNDNFALRFTGLISITQAGSYTFYTESDDGSALFINNQQVVDNDGLHSARERSGSITLSAGLHQITVTFFESGGGEVLNVRMAGPGLAKQLIPDNVLFSGGGMTYRSFAQTADFAGGSNLALNDSGDMDGVNNALELVLNGNTAVADRDVIEPRFEVSNGAMIYTFRLRPGLDPSITFSLLQGDAMNNFVERTDLVATPAGTDTDGTPLMRFVVPMDGASKASLLRMLVNVPD